MASQREDSVLNVRRATLADLDVIVAGNLSLAEESEGLHLDPETLRQGVQALLEGRVPGRYWVADRGNEVVGQLLVTYEWSDWRNCMVWWIQSVHVAPAARRDGVFRTLYAHTRQEAMAAGAGGLRLYVDVTNTRAQAVYAAMGMNGDHYRVFEEMFDDPARKDVGQTGE
jgi:ribosomal protein S18 acetylase RimI-like enzyme